MALDASDREAEISPPSPDAVTESQNEARNHPDNLHGLGWVQSQEPRYAEKRKDKHRLQKTLHGDLSSIFTPPVCVL